MRTLVVCCCIVGALAVAIVFGILACQFPTGDFWNSILLNLAAEFVGVAIGIGLTIAIATAFAKKKFREIAVPFSDLVARLRMDGSISPRAARRSVIFGVRLLAEDGFGKARDSGKPSANSTCGICSFRASTKDFGGGRKLCSYCKLPDGVWTVRG